MFTKVDKSLVALIVPLILYLIDYLSKTYGFAVTPEVQSALETVLLWALPILTGLAVYWIPNKK